MKRVLLHKEGQKIEVEFAEGHPRPVILNQTFRAEFVNITSYEWTADELLLFAPKDFIAIPRYSVAFIIVKHVQPESEEQRDGRKQSA